MRHRTSVKFWRHYNALPIEIRTLADENFALVKADPRHPSLHFKKAGRFWSARVGIDYRAVAIESGSDMVWFWIGPHDEYDEVLQRG